MRVKRYVAENLQDAMLKVKMDMGKDAVILHTRKFKEGGFFGFFGKTMVEVTAAVEDNPISPVSQPKPTAQKVANQAQVHSFATFKEKAGGVDDERNADLQAELQEMKMLMYEMKSQMEANLDAKSLPEPLQRFHQILIDNEVEEALAAKILKGLLKTYPAEEPVEGHKLKKSLEQSMLKILRRPKPITFKKQGLHQQVVALIGPTGVGKTTTIAKLAATFSIVDKKKVALITADTYRVAAVEQLKTYGEIIGIPVNVVYTPEELRDSIGQHTDKDLILIDTAGRSHKNVAQMAELKAYLDAADATEILLVLSATTKYKDMLEIINSYSDIPLTKLVFTKLDETSTYGAILNIINKTQKHLSYVTVGQNVPDDIEIADPEKIVKMIVKER
ncbi:flagellar biosynthetic protein FlhF [Thermincola ferriacetica]|uniref:Flagellar biosynthesis protein FlhF n=1 Tax=Thermincola ferriacetica TaxID=281456 RepID=A0A0L6W5K9_9FIRM|nr:flagellar biosynthesis protein FlhF [Thermincola ferriacetica]KNZ70867.1 flagellar biosynthetic protein FlhF [Thermincola ferriacetica]